MKNEHKEIIDLVTKYIDLTVIPFGKENRTVLEIEKRTAMYDGSGSVYMLSLFEAGELVNNRIGVYMILPYKGDEAGFHEHGLKNEQELYVVMNGEGLYSESSNAKDIIVQKQLKKGNVTLIHGNNNYHSVKNTGDEPLIIFVVTTYQK